MISRLKEKLKHSLSLSTKLFVKRLFVGGVRILVRTAAYGYGLTESLRERAIEHGMDWHRAWNLKGDPVPAAVPAFGVSDLFFLKDLLNGSSSETSPDYLEIRTSIIIPVFNNAELTFQCLRSLLREVDLRTTEIIVVNDASTDETGELLMLFGKYVRVVNNEENKGFGETCNRGAAAANGRYLVFLNNDTWVLPGWLSELEPTIEGDESIGAVGSMFLYPDGRVQEAGAIIWRSGNAFHYGWNRSPDDRRLNFAREVDYCSAASLLIRKDLFDRLGGFDRRYSPAYYEDTDLCMGVRQLGQKVIYQPASRLIHYKGITLGTDVRFGLKRYQDTNRAKFQEKWRGVLETDHIPEDQSSVAQAADRRGISVLVIDDRIPTPDRDAGSARMALILKSLAAWSRPVFARASKQVWPKYEQQLWKAGVQTTSVTELPGSMREREFAVAIVSRADIAAAVMSALRRRNPKLKIIYDQVDLSFLRLEREFELKGGDDLKNEAARCKRIEIQMARMADVVWCASVEDQRAIAALVPETPSVVIPTIHPLGDSGKPFEEREGLIFLGNMIHRPNADSVRFLADEIMPLVRLELPEAVLQVVGSGMTPEIEALSSDSVCVLGYVPDIGPMFDSCRMMVAPLRFGAGINGKIGEAMASGLPVVTTTTGAVSFGIGHEIEAMIADTPEDLATAIVRLYRDKKLWQKLAAGGRKLIAENYTPEVVSQIINKSIRNLVE
jgi:GT2 family glycosyltransferase